MEPTTASKWSEWRSSMYAEWTEAEDRFLLENKDKMSKKEIAIKLDRTYEAVRMRASTIGATTPRVRKDPIYIPYFLTKGIQKHCRFAKNTNRWVTTRKKPDGVWQVTSVARLVYADAFGEIPGNYHVHHCDGQSQDLNRDLPSNYILLTPPWNLRYMKQLSFGLGLPEAIVTTAFLQVTGVRAPEIPAPDAKTFKEMVQRLLKEPPQFHTPTLGTHLDCRNDGVAFKTYNGRGEKSPYLNTQISVKRDRYAVVLENGITTSHARRVYLYYNGPIKPGYHIHHCDSNELNDSPENLIQIPFKFNSDYLPCISEPLCVPETAVSQIYRKALDSGVPEEEIYRTVIRKAIKLKPSADVAAGIAAKNATRSMIDNRTKRVPIRKPRREPPPASVKCGNPECTEMVLANHYYDKVRKKWYVTQKFCTTHNS